nr:M81 family metallopeptidase [Sphingomonas sp. Y57]
MRIFIASLGTETNSFATIPTGLADFELNGLFRGDGSARAPEGVGSYVHHMRMAAERAGLDVAESLAAWAVPGGPTVRSAYEHLRDALLEDLRAAMPVDIVQLTLHGAMIAEDYDDCEGDLLEAVRAIVGPLVAVGAELDLHCHFTERMRCSADAIICFKHYPHVDWRERADELLDILIRTRRGDIRPVTAVHDCDMIGFFHTTREPMRSFVAHMEAFEGRDGILSVSLGHGFPCGDVPETGARLWVIADGDASRAQALADRLGSDFWALRDQVAARSIDVAQALDQAQAATRSPVVIADVADNPGGGAPGDSSFILAHIIERRIANVALGAIWDPLAVAICRTAGVGARLLLRIGGKAGPTSGAPVDLEVVVRGLADDHGQSTYGGWQPFGPAAWVEGPHALHILLVSQRNQIKALDAFTGIGISLADRALIVVKSAQHFHAAFAPLAADILYASTPGAVPADFARPIYTKRDGNYWPHVERPHGRLVDMLASREGREG